MEMGKIMPAYDNGEQVRQWRVPISAFLAPKMTPLEVIAVYEDEGHLCIDVQEPQEPQ